MIAEQRRASWAHHPLIEIAVITFISSIVGYIFGFLRFELSFSLFYSQGRSGTPELVANLFRECEEVEVDFHGLCKYILSLQLLVYSLF